MKTKPQHLTISMIFLLLLIACVLLPKVAFSKSESGGNCHGYKIIYDKATDEKYECLSNGKLSETSEFHIKHDSPMDFLVINVNPFVEKVTIVPGEGISYNYSLPTESLTGLDDGIIKHLAGYFGLSFTNIESNLPNVPGKKEGSSERMQAQNKPTAVGDYNNAVKEFNTMVSGIILADKIFKLNEVTTPFIAEQMLRDTTEGIRPLCNNDNPMWTKETFVIDNCSKINCPKLKAEKVGVFSPSQLLGLLSKGENLCKNIVDKYQLLSKDEKNAIKHDSIKDNDKPDAGCIVDISDQVNTIIKNYLKIVNTSYTVSNKEAIATADEYKVQVNTAPKSATGTAEVSIFPVKVDGGMKPEYSTGIFFSTLKDKTYTSKIAPDGTYNIVRSDSGSSAHLSLLRHFHKRGEKYGQSFGISGSDVDSLQYYLGESLFYGEEKQRMIFSIGGAFGKVQRLSPGLSENHSYITSPNIEHEKIYKAGYFFGVSFNY